MYDAFRKEDFICRAIIFVTTNDYPVLFALSGQIKGKTGCLVCLDGTTCVFLDASKKIDSLPKEPALFKDKSQVPWQIVL